MESVSPQWLNVLPGIRLQVWKERVVFALCKNELIADKRFVELRRNGVGETVSARICKARSRGT